MAIVKGPAYSDTAVGSLGRNLVFSQSGRLAFVRSKTLIVDKATARRRAQRDVFRAAADAWNLLTTEAKNEYNLLAKRLKLTGYNLFLREYVATVAAAIIGLGRIGLMRIGKGA
jgi:hypothetical protein